MISNSKSDAISDVEEWEAIGHEKEDEQVEQGQLDMGPDMGVGVGARRTGMDKGMGRDRGTRGKGVGMSMGKMDMSRGVNHACAHPEPSQLRAPGDELAKQGPQNPPRRCFADVCPAGHALWGEHDQERRASPDSGDSQGGDHRWGMAGTTSHEARASGISAVVDESAGAELLVNFQNGAPVNLHSSRSPAGPEAERERRKKDGPRARPEGFGEAIGCEWQCV